MSDSISVSRKMFFLIIIALLVLVFIVGMATSMYLNQTNSANTNPTTTPNPTPKPTTVSTPTSTPSVTPDIKSGEAIQIQSVSQLSIGGKVFTLYVQNVGDSALSLSNTNSVFINGEVSNPAGTWATHTTPLTLNQGETGTYVATGAGLTAGVHSITFKVTTTDGTFSQITQQFTIR
jgi:archaellum component FlaG (FlaF/FlaG flagellin family)